MNEKPYVAVSRGSGFNLSTVQGKFDVLESLGIACDGKVTSAHCVSVAIHAYVKDADNRGRAAVRLAVRLGGAGVVNTCKAVNGILIGAGLLNGVSSLCSTVQMPDGILVGTVAIGKSGAKNACCLVTQTIAFSYPELANRFAEGRSGNAEGPEGPPKQE